MSAFRSDREPRIRRSGVKRLRYFDESSGEPASSCAENKFADLIDFGTKLGPLRRRVSRDLARNDLGQERVIATLVRLMDITSLRIGNLAYATTNDSFGLTTLRNEHATVRGSTIRLSFRGKSAHAFDLSIDNARLASVVRRCQDLPGQVDAPNRACGVPKQLRPPGCKTLRFLRRTTNSPATD